MKKKISEINLYRINLATGDPDDESELFQEIPVNRVVLNENGHETERITYNSFGEPEERVVTRWEGDHAVEEILELDGEVVERTTREYDEEGRVLKEWRHYTEGGTDEIRYFYKEDKLLMKQAYDSDGEEGEKHFWTYKNGLLVSEEAYDDDNTAEMKKSYLYSKEGVLEEVIEIQYTTDGELKTVSVMDEEGRLIAEKRYDLRGNLIARTLITLGENGHPATMVEESSARPKTVIHFEYDSNGNNTLYREETEDGSILSLITREFDEDGRNSASEVRIEPQQQRPGQHYRLRYEYSYFD